MNNILVPNETLDAFAAHNLALEERYQEQIAPLSSLFDELLKEFYTHYEENRALKLANKDELVEGFGPDDITYLFVDFTRLPRIINYARSMRIGLTLAGAHPKEYELARRIKNSTHFKNVDKSLDIARLSNDLYARVMQTIQRLEQNLDSPLPKPPLVSPQ